MDRVKAKFKCNSITDNGYGKQAQLSAVCGNQGENADFTRATPSGELKISISNDVPAANFFEPQKDYYLYFEKAE